MIDISDFRAMTEEEKKEYSKKEEPVKLESNKNIITIESMSNLK